MSLELQLTVLSSEVEELSALLAELGTQGIQEEELGGNAPRQLWDEPREEASRGDARVLLRAWFDESARDAVDAALRERRLATTWSKIADTDWDEEWKKNFPPLRVSERITIAPPWDAPEGSIVIEPGQGFGTGQHPSTRACLVAVDELARTGEVHTFLDVGCGSGILAIAAARLGMTGRGIDVEEPAVVEARANAARNGVSVAFDTTPIERVTEGADLVLANLHAEVLVPLAADLVRLSGQWLVVGGVLADREEKVRAAFEPALKLVHRVTEDRWVSLRYARHG